MTQSPPGVTPSLSLIYQPPSWVEPLRWDQVFPVPRPVEVDIGCGKGAFLAWAAKTNPTHNFLGVERLLGRLRKAESKARRSGLTNVRLLRIEAGYFVQYLVPTATITAYHIYFADPWPKRRHHKRRLMGGEFVARVADTLVDGGAVNIATDHEDYALQIREAFGASSRFREAAPLALPPEAQTEFERIFLAQGLPVYRSRWLKAGPTLPG